MKRFSLIIEVHLILIENNKILLLKRVNTGYEDGNYGLIAGHMDGDETARCAMAREAREEAGISIFPDDLEMVHVVHRKAEKERISFFFKPDKYLGTPINREPDKCEELAWFPLDSLPDNLIPYIRQALNEYQKNSAYSEFGW